MAESTTDNIIASIFDFGFDETGDGVSGINCGSIGAAGEFVALSGCIYIM